MATLVFGRKPSSLELCVLVLIPAGDASFDLALRVGLVKSSTDLTRPIVLAVAYTFFNLGGGISTILIDVIR